MDEEEGGVLNKEISMSKIRNKLTPYWFLLPPFILYLIWVVGPAFYSFYLSFTDWNGISRLNFVGFSNYIKLFHDRVFYISLINNFKWVLIFTTVPVGIGLGLALLLDKPIKGMRILKTTFFLPMAISLVAINMMWSWIYNPAYGLLNTTLKTIGLGSFTQGWLADPKLVLYCILAAASWNHAAFVLVLFVAGLSSIPPDLIEAAKVEGASPWNIIRYVTIPLLRPATVIVIITTVVTSLRVFDLVYTMTRGGPFHSSNVLANFMFRESFHNYKMGYGSSIAVILFLMSITFIFLYLKQILKKEIEY